MDTQERLQTADALLQRARELMKEAENPETKDSRVRQAVFMADAYAHIASGYLKAIEVRNL